MRLFPSVPHRADWRIARMREKVAQLQRGRCGLDGGHLEEGLSSRAKVFNRRSQCSPINSTSESAAFWKKSLEPGGSGRPSQQRVSCGTPRVARLRPSARGVLRHRRGLGARAALRGVGPAFRACARRDTPPSSPRVEKRCQPPNLGKWVRWLAASYPDLVAGTFSTQCHRPGASRQHRARRRAAIQPARARPARRSFMVPRFGDCLRIACLRIVVGA